MRIIVTSFALLLVKSTMAGPPLPAPGDLDLSFAEDGTLIPEIGVSDLAWEGFFEENGEMVIFGETSNANVSTRAGILLKLSEDGSEQTITRFPAAAPGCPVPRAFLGALRLQSGDFAAGGYVQIGCAGVPRQFNVLTVTPQGTALDEFDRVPFSNQLAYVRAMAEQPDGKIVAVGFSSGSGFDGATFDIAVARFLSDGSLDEGFAVDGTFNYDLEGDQDLANDVVITDTGRIVVGGYGTTAISDRDILVLALNESGLPDPSFGNTGLFQYDRAGFFDSMGGLVQLNDGRIVVAGVSSPDENTREATIIAIAEDGSSLDPNFGDNGVVVLDLGPTAASLLTITAGPGGLLYVAGSVEVGGEGLEFRDALVSVLTQNGAPYQGFFDAEPIIFEFGGQPRDEVLDISVNETASRVLVTGYTEDAERTSRQFGVARIIGLEQPVFGDGFEAREQ